jgi:sporulation protein YlmC with PRC-barrel domain
MNMQKKFFTVSAFAAALTMSPVAFGQVAAGVDPACVIKNADGTDTVDMTKCPDGMKPSTGDNAAAPVDPAAPANNNAAAPADPAAPATAMERTLIVPSESFTGATVMSANDFIGKRVYTRAGEDIGEVNDFILTGNGGIQAVVLGVGGFLGIGEKDVAVSMASIDMTKDGDAVRLVVDGSKEQFNAAPSYDRTTRTYLK